MKIAFNLNGESVEAEADPRTSLLRLLRDAFALTGTKEGCGAGECGTCTVLLDGEAVNACLVPAGQVNGREVVTVEGLGSSADPHPVVRSFAEAGAVQCGFCTPGMVLSTVALLEANPSPSDGEIKEALSGNLCRCTGYQPILEAVKRAAKKLEGAEK